MEIAKALYKKARIVIMDEPTASLSGAEIDNLFRLICQLRQERVSVIYISHRLDEIFEIADKVTVLRDGWKVLTVAIADITKEQLVKAMVGEELTMTRIAGSPGARVLLEADGISHGKAFQDVSFALRRGMIVAFAGTARARAAPTSCGRSPGSSRSTRGRIRFKGEEIAGQGARRASSSGASASCPASGTRAG